MKIYLSEYLNYKIKLHFKYSVSKHKISIILLIMVTFWGEKLPVCLTVRKSECDDKSI